MDASFEKVGERYVLVVERRLAFPPAKVWRVLTERNLMQQWFPGDVEGEWRVGAPLQFTFLHGEGEGLSEDEMRGEVLAVEPERLLEFRWGKGVIRCEITPDGDGSKLVLSETLDDPSMAARSSAGWELCLETMSLVLDGATVAEFAWELWKPKFERYVEKFQARFGPQQGPPDDHPVAKEDGAEEG